jgi:hypothetical protein
VKVGTSALRCPCRVKRGATLAPRVGASQREPPLTLVRRFMVPSTSCLDEIMISKCPHMDPGNKPRGLTENARIVRDINS